MASDSTEELTFGQGEYWNPQTPSWSAWKHVGATTFTGDVGGTPVRPQASGPPSSEQASTCFASSDMDDTTFTDHVDGISVPPQSSDPASSEQALHEAVAWLSAQLDLLMNGKQQYGIEAHRMQLESVLSQALPEHYAV